MSDKNTSVPRLLRKPTCTAPRACTASTTLHVLCTAHMLLVLQGKLSLTFSDCIDSAEPAGHVRGVSMTHASKPKLVGGYEPGAVVSGWTVGWE